LTEIGYCFDGKAEGGASHDVEGQVGSNIDAGKPDGGHSSCDEKTPLGRHGPGPPPD
jgi:hypothetical protein